MDKRRSQISSPHPHWDHFGPITNGTTSLERHSGVPLRPMVFWKFLMERCATKREDIVEKMEPLGSEKAERKEPIGSMKEEKNRQ